MSTPPEPPAERTEEDRPVVAVFDFDGTLTRRDSLLPFLWATGGPLSFIWNATVLLPTLLRYALGTLENSPAKERVLGQFLAGKSVEKIQAVAESFAAEWVPSLLDPEAMRRLRWHQEQGHECVLVSASMDVYLDAWGKREGFSEVICTALKEDASGHVSGGIQGGNCYGKEKYRRVLQWQSGKYLTDTYAYGDSSGDVPMLTAVKNGYLWKKDKFHSI